MTDYFHFLGLPLVVQELVINEIVHNSIPEDRIQLALTSKYCNELVQRARPKKIIDQFTVQFLSIFIFIADSKKYTKTKEELMEILPNCQIKKLQLRESQNSPLSFFELKCSLTLEKCQQYLQTAEFSIGADISIRYHRMHVPVYLIHLGQNIFTLEMFSNNSCPIIISQKFVGRNRRILKLKRSDFFQQKSSEIAFNVMSASNLDKNYFSGAFEEGQQKMLIKLENVDLDEILTVKFVDERIKCRNGNRVTEYYVCSRHSAKMLESAFPTVNFTTPEERVKTMNNVLGTKIQPIHAENFAQVVKVLIQDSSS